MSDTPESVRAETTRLASFLSNVATALRESPESVIFANGGAFVRSIKLATSPRSFDAEQ
jgi:hypothetical protein